MPARHDGGVGHPSRFGEQDHRQDRADQGEGGADAEGRGVALVEDAVDGAGGERDHQLNTIKEQYGISNLLVQMMLEGKSMMKNRRFFLLPVEGRWRC